MKITPSNSNDVGNYKCFIFEVVKSSSVIEIFTLQTMILRNVPPHAENGICGEPLLDVVEVNYHPPEKDITLQKKRCECWDINILPSVVPRK